MIKNINKYTNQVTQIGTGIATSNAAVTVMIEKLTDKKANITDFGKMRIYDIREWKATDKQDNLISLEEGLALIYDNIKRGLKKKNPYN